MSSLTDYSKSLLHQWVFATNAPTRPAALYLGLFSVLPADDGTGGTEVSGGGYARVLCGPGDALWSFVINQSKNVGELAFPRPTGDWGTPGFWAIYDAATGGNFIFSGAITSPVEITSGSLEPTLVANAMVITWA